MDNKHVVLVGMGGHALVVLDALRLSGRSVVGYCDHVPKKQREEELPYLGSEDSTAGNAALLMHDFMVTIGDNKKRYILSHVLLERGFHEAMPAIHPTANLAGDVLVGRGTQVQGGVFVNVDTTVGCGVILNTGCIVEHECEIHDFAHIGPGAVLAGNVTVGRRAFVGANATIIQGVVIGEDVIVGAGAVVLKDVPPGRTIVGNPGRLLPK